VLNSNQYLSRQPLGMPCLPWLDILIIILRIILTDIAIDAGYLLAQTQ
jgi:hypothetical protein